ncbi:MAG: hypothetical protein JST62_13215 [Bacteroidetes bacterium]|nr:hypothetical protein [Bacteroidota bacterium]
MLQHFSRTRAAVILAKLEPFSSVNCNNREDIRLFLKKVINGAIEYYSKFKTIDNTFKTEIIFCFTNCAYFFYKGFNSSDEDVIFQDCMFDMTKGVMSKVFSTVSKSDYFSMDLNSIFDDVNEDNNGLNIFEDYDLASSSPLPDMEESLYNAYLMCQLMLSKKQRIVSPKEYKEFIIFHTLDLFLEYQKGGDFVPQSVINKIYDQIRNAATRAFEVPYSQLSPEQELIDNCYTELLINAKEKYFLYMMR